MAGHIDKSRLLLCRTFLSIQVKSDQLSEIPEHPDDLGPVQSRGPRIDGAERAEEFPVRENDRHRDITLQAIHPGRMVAAVILILRHVIDDDRAAAIENFVADCRL